MLHRVVSGVVAVLLLLSAKSACAVTKNWNDGTDNWTNGGNWTPIGAPAAGDTVNIVYAEDVTRTVTYDYTGPAITLGQLTVDQTVAGTNAATLAIPANSLTTGQQNIGASGRGSVIQSGGTNASNGGLVLGLISTGVGSYTLSAGSLTLTGSSEVVGFSGTGTFDQSGGTNTTPGLLDLGYYPGSNGTYTLSGTGQVSAGDEYIGDTGNGTFSQSGGINTTGELSLGAFTGGQGTYSLTAGTLNATDETIAYRNQTIGTFSQSGGIHNASRLSVGRFGGSTGSFTLSGGSLAVSTDEFIAEDGNGTFTQTGGAHTVAGNLNVATYASSSASYSASGGVLSAANIYVGGRSAGAGGAGTFAVSGSNTIVTVPGTIKVYNTAGTAFDLQGGTVNVGAINVNGVPSLFNWTGGTLNITNDLALDSAAGLTSTAAAFGTSLSVSSSKLLKVAGNETIGGVGAFGLSLGGNSSGGPAHVVTGNVTLKPGGTLSANGGNLICANLIQAGGSITGQLRNLSNFTYQSGSFTGSLINDGTVSFGSTLTVQSLINEASMTVSPGQLLTATSGVTNSGTLLVNAGSISTSSFGNTGNTTFNNGGFVGFSTAITNSGSLVLNGGSIPGGSVTNSGTFVQNGGTISVSTFTNSVSGNVTAHGSFGGQLVNHGTLTVDGAFTFTNSFTVTQDGIVQGTGTISNASGSTLFNNSAGGVINSTTPNGTLVINNLSTNNSGALINIGPTSTLSLASFNGTGGWTNSGTVTMQGPGARLAGMPMTLQNGAILQGAGLVTVSLGSSNNGVIRASGGELAFTASALTNSAQSTIQVLAGSTINFMQGIATNSGQISLVGGTFENSNRTLQNSGTINGYGTLRTGGLTNNAGRLLSIGEGNLDVFGSVTNNGLISIQSTRSAFFFGPVSGSGSFTGTGTAVFLNTFAPGNSPAFVSFAGNATLGTSLDMEIGGLTPGTNYDQLNVAGLLSVGGALNVSLISGFTPTAGQSFDLLDCSALAGTFSTLNLPALVSGLAWNTSQLYTTGVLSVTTAPGVPGDYNNNGTVDAADFILWRKGGPLANEVDNPGTVNGADYTEWRARFGNGGGSGAGLGATGSASASQIPEPASIILLTIATACSLCVVREPSHRPGPFWPLRGRRNRHIVAGSTHLAAARECSDNCPLRSGLMVRFAPPRRRGPSWPRSGRGM